MELGLSAGKHPHGSTVQRPTHKEFLQENPQILCIPGLKSYLALKVQSLLSCGKSRPVGLTPALVWEAAVLIFRIIQTPKKARHKPKAQGGGGPAAASP